MRTIFDLLLNFTGQQAKPALDDACAPACFNSCPPKLHGIGYLHTVPYSEFAITPLQGSRRLNCSRLSEKHKKTISISAGIVYNTFKACRAMQQKPSAGRTGPA